MCFFNISLFYCAVEANNGTIVGQITIARFAYIAVHNFVCAFLSAHAPIEIWLSIHMLLWIASTSVRLIWHIKLVNVIPIRPIVY